MSLLTNNEIEHYLKRLQNTLLHYDYSSVSNLLFYDVHSFTQYLRTHPNNPFEKQYQEVEDLLEILSPYIDTVSPYEMALLFKELENENPGNIMIAQDLFFSSKLDFLDRIKDIHSEKEWTQLIEECIQRKAAIPYSL